MKKWAMLLIATVTLAGCEATQRQNATTGENETNSTTKGAVVGAVVGALTGLATGGNATERRQHALIGATGGAAVGAGVGYYFDRQEAQLRKSLLDSGVQVQRVNDSQIKLVMQNGIGFNSDSYHLDSSIYKSLNGVAKVLVEYPKTRLRINGYTDSTGSQSYNQSLSERRANSVREYLINQNVSPQRIGIYGHGENAPLCSNATAQGRKCNRRVEIQITPNQ
ncbi:MULTISPECIES: OmpA family protein [Vibrio]|uniref:OmpA family protein n=2 Tax=Vibrio TaxID=662 RepID=A0A7X4RW33_9VIBR|nr:MULTISPECIES: OmpA family protein [Vibrio]MBF8999715.1 OmpA family protein [Vibrio nitrifigilis]MZI94912.1 OmpA family protein [Vibrio eleionomae]